MSNPASPQSLRLLSLDGGGVKGLASLLILKRIFRTLQTVDKLNEIPRPCDYFDVIGGTSTGGLIAIMLGRLQMTIDECIQVFQQVSETVFGDSPSQLSRAFSGVSGRKTFFKGEKLEKVIKDLLIRRELDPDTLLNDPKCTGCKVFVCTTRPQTVHPVLLRSFTTFAEGDENYACDIWEAARATTAAPLFFEPIKLKQSGITLLDGAMRLNNPISVVVTEAKDLFPNGTFTSIISIGTGLTDVKGLAVENLKAHNVIKTCVDISINANNEAEAFAKSIHGRELLENKIYFRFDVVRGLDTIALEEWKKLDDIDALTERYLAQADKREDLRNCAKSLSKNASLHTTNVQKKCSKNTLLSTLPRYSNPCFSGRVKEFAAIDETFDNSPVLHQRIVLFGLGGIGKSQIAHNYGQRQSTQRSVFWVRANTVEDFELGYVAIARHLLLDLQDVAPSDRLVAVQTNLEGANTFPWLLILDQADDKDVFSSSLHGRKLAEYIPMASHGRVLITTTDSRVAGLCGGQVAPAQNGIRIGPMDLEDSFSLFGKCMRKDAMLDVSMARCSNLLALLGGLPLAIVQAASYIREEEISAEDFVALYNDIELHGGLFEEPSTSTDMEQKSVLFTWEISYKRIAGPSYPNSKSSAAMLLDMLAFLDAQESPLRYLNEIEYSMKDWAEPILGRTDLEMIKSNFEPQQSPSSLLQSVFNSKCTKNVTFKSAIGRLCNYSLIGSRECWVHPVVHNWICRRLDPPERCKYISWMAEELTKHVPMMELDDWGKYVVPIHVFTVLVQKDLGILRHVDVIAKHTLSPVMIEHMKTNRILIPGIGDLLYRFGVISVYSGKSIEGVSYIRQSIVATARTDQNEGLIKERKLLLAKAMSRLCSTEQAVAEARLCHDETSTLEAEYWLAQCLKNNGELQEALEILRNIIRKNPITSPQQFEKNKIRFMATVDTVANLVDLGDEESKRQARHLIDKRILPYLKHTPFGHVLNTFTYPQILISRIEAAADREDQKAACKAVIDFETRHGRSVSPVNWLAHLDKLEQKGKSQEIVTLTKAFTRRRPPIPDYMASVVNNPDIAERIDEEVISWCDTYNFLGTAYSALGKFYKAEIAHKSAISLHLSVHSEGAESELFCTNLGNFLTALSCQGDAKKCDIEAIRLSLGDFLEGLTVELMCSDHERQRGNRLILDWGEHEEVERFSRPGGIAVLKKT